MTARATLSLLVALALILPSAGPARAQVVFGDPSVRPNLTDLFDHLMGQTNHLRGSRRGMELDREVVFTYDLFFFPAGKVVRVTRISSADPRRPYNKRSFEAGSFALDDEEQSITFYFRGSGRESYPAAIFFPQRTMLIGELALAPVDDYGLVGVGFEPDQRLVITAVGEEARQSPFRQVYRATGEGFLIATLPRAGDYQIILVDQQGRLNPFKRITVGRATTWSLIDLEFWKD